MHIHTPGKSKEIYIYKTSNNECQYYFSIISNPPIKWPNVITDLREKYKSKFAKIPFNYYIPFISNMLLNIRWQKHKPLLDFVDQIFTTKLKAFTIAGGLIVFLYSMHISFYPKGLQPGDIIFFLFVIAATSLIYGIAIALGGFTCLWLIMLICKIFKWLKPKSNFKLKKQINDPIFCIGSIVVSLMIVLLSIIKSVKSDDPRFHLFITLLLTGGVLLLLFGSNALDTVRNGDVGSSMLTRQALKKRDLKLFATFILFISLPLFLVSNLFSLIEISMITLGIRAENVTIRMNAADHRVITEIADRMNMPLVACQSKLSDQTFFISNVKVLWQGIGETTLIELTKPSVDQKPLDKYLRIPLKSNDISVITTTSPLKAC